MQNIIYVGKDGRPSMVNVYGKMQTGNLVVRRKLPHKTFYRVYTNNKLKRIKKKEIDLKNAKVIIRWGTQEVLDIPKGCIVYNKCSVLKNITHKLEARLIMASKGVNVPLNITEETKLCDMVFPIIARPYFHSKGKNFVVLPDYEAYVNHYVNNSDWYYSNFVDKVQEFRVHCLAGKILNYLEKPNPNNGNIAWNRAQNEEPFVSVKWSDYNINVATEALKACQALDADFVGVDVLLDKDGKAWVLECNSAPTLNSSEYSCERYAKAFDWLFASETKRKHWDFTKFKKVTSLAWKNFQLEQQDEEN